MKSLERLALVCLALAAMMACLVIGQMIVQSAGMPAHAAQAVVPAAAR
jgi:hypothetical protein